jgi:hypothetical protein
MANGAFRTGQQQAIGGGVVDFLQDVLQRRRSADERITEEQFRREQQEDKALMDIIGRTDLPPQELFAAIQEKRIPEEAGFIQPPSPTPRRIVVSEDLRSLIKQRSGADVPIGLELPEGAITNLVVRVPETEAQKLAQRQAVEDIKIASKQKQEVQKFKTNFGRVETLMGRMFAQFKGGLLEGGVFRGGGVIKGNVKRIAGKLKIPGFELTDAFSGQKFETALTLNSILTGQNRVIRGVLQNILTTLPEATDTETFAAQKIEQSIRNSFGLTKAMQRAGINKEFIKKLSDKELNDPNSNINQQIQGLSPAELTPDEEAELDAILDRILNVEPARPVRERLQRQPVRQKVDFNSIAEANAANLPIGTRITINGRTAVIE